MFNQPYGLAVTILACALASCAPLPRDTTNASADRTAADSATHLSLPEDIRQALDPADFDTRPIEPIELHLAMKPLDREVIFRKEPFDTSSFPVRLQQPDGSSVEGRAEVSGSFSRRFLKKSIRIELAGDARWHHNRRVSLDAMATDPSYLREWAAWDLAHALGMTAPDVRMVRLHINDAYVGPFMQFDWIDPAMMARQGLGSDGALYHPKDAEFCGGFANPAREELARCWFELAPRGGGYAELSQLARELAETPAADFDDYLERRFDVDSVINWVLLNTITSNTDTYNKNYFLYLSRKTGKWLVVPWDYDLSFGRNADPALPFPQTILNDNFQYFYTPELGNDNPLKQKLLSNPALYARFQARLAHVLGVAHDTRAPDDAFGWFAPEIFRSRLADWARTLLPDAQQDVHSATSSEDFIQHVEALDHYNLLRYTVLRHQVLGTTVFGTARWLPYRSYPLLEEAAPNAPDARMRTPLDLSGTVELTTPDARVAAVDKQFSRPVGIFRRGTGGEPVRVRIEAETERRPAVVPPGKAPGQCIERTWFVDLKTPGTTLTTDLIVDYLEESSIHHEVGSGIGDQNRLSLWSLADGTWTALPTHANATSKTLTTRDLSLRPGQVERIVACAD
ncbi:MAG: CotH kinase family protein [Azoarcus sp.]|nr:CotH kinase family protein [Azoarcus sp.]